MVTEADGFQTAKIKALLKLIFFLLFLKTAFNEECHKYYGSDHHRRSAKKNRHHIQFTFGVYYKAAEYLLSRPIY